MGNMVQSNSIGAAFSEVFQARGINIPPIAIGLLLAAAGFVFLGGNAAACLCRGKNCTNYGRRLYFRKYYINYNAYHRSTKCIKDDPCWCIPAKSNCRWCNGYYSQRSHSLWCCERSVL